MRRYETASAISASSPTDPIVARRIHPSARPVAARRLAQLTRQDAGLIGAVSPAGSAQVALFGRLSRAGIRGVAECRLWLVLAGSDAGLLNRAAWARIWSGTDGHDGLGRSWPMPG